MAQPQIVLNYRPREYFKKFHSRIQRHAILLCHRRSGKTVGVINDMVARALHTRKKRWFGAYIGPYMSQAKQVSWAYLKDAVRDIPGIKINETLTFITFPNGSTIRVFGADNADALRGLYFDMVVLDEVGDIKKRVWSEIIRPALADRKGSAIFMGTPKGKNWFFDQWQKAVKSDSWYSLKLDYKDTNIIPEREIEEIREDLDDSEFNQEFMCSWEGSLRGAYFTKQIEAIKANRQVGVVPHSPSYLVHCAMDVGFNDSTVIWFWQYIDGRVKVIDYFERNEMDAAEIVTMLHKRPYRYATVWMPHDAFHHTFATKKSAFDTFTRGIPEDSIPGLPAKRTPAPDKGNRIYHGIDIARKVLRTYPLDFDAEKCGPGIEALLNYSRKYDKDRQIFVNTPNHDRWSHGADGFRYMAIVLDPTEIQRSLEDAYRSGRLAAPKLDAAVNTLHIAPLTLNEMIRVNRIGNERRARFENKGRN